MANVEKYIIIPLQWLEVMNASEAVVYAYLHGFLSNGKKILMKQEQMAINLNIPLRTFKGILDRLKSRGLVSVTREGGSAKIALCEVQNLHLQSAEVAPTECRNCTLPSAETAPTPIYKKEENKKENKRESKADVSHPVSVDVLFSSLHNEISGNAETANLYTSTTGLTQAQVFEGLNLFQQKLKLDGVIVKTPDDYRKHFNAWLVKNAKSIFPEINNAGMNNGANKYTGTLAAMKNEIWHDLGFEGDAPPNWKGFR